ncbi:MAG: hypothetical protein V2I33_14840 [Kangiellaceae bacterium]|jgi:hypothetical protein|nr:hypothetical protein [Kangiellaceae bacterium]
MKLDFIADEAAVEYCEDIIAILVSDYSLTRNQAIELINRFWHGQVIQGDDMIYHDLPEDWAKHFSKEVREDS